VAPTALDRVVTARLQLRERFLAKQRATPALSDSRPQGSGGPNRHGMPRLPPDQVAAQKWPVLDLGVKPDLPLQSWTLSLDGAVEGALRLSWTEFLALPQVEEESDFHCVTGWSLLDARFAGVQFSTLAALARPLPAATHVLVHAADGYSTNLPLEEALKDDVLLVHAWEGKPLPQDHGGPVRMVTPQLWAWKGAKWVTRIEFLEEDRKGFWELRGYSNTAHPWRNDRYGE
jgi:DMSO/TMAO reductase YedYZ molybdopterin-dependent catalytic subunit